MLLTASAVKSENHVIAQRARDMNITLIDRGDLGRRDLGAQLVRIAKSWPES